MLNMRKITDKRKINGISGKIFGTPSFIVIKKYEDIHAFGHRNQRKHSLNTPHFVS